MSSDHQDIPPTFHAQLLDSVRESVVATDLDGNVFYWGKGAEKLFGYTAEEVIGKTFIVTSEQEREHIERMHKVRESGYWKGQYNLRRKDGSKFDAETFISLIEDDKGQPCGFIAIDRDVSLRKQTEDQVRALHNQLAHMSRLSTMGEMATGLAHELNQPLTAIVNFSLGCVRRIQDGTIQQNGLVSALNEITAAAKHAGEIIRKVRRLVAQHEPERTVLDIREVISEVLALVRHQIRFQEVEVSVRVSNGLPQVSADKIQIQQVLLNLLINGVEAMADTDKAERQIIIEVAKEDDRVRIAISDCGCGLPAEDADNIFNQFFTTKEEGMGLGLAISRSIIENHGGRLWAETRPDGGSTFAFTLPGSRKGG